MRYVVLGLGLLLVLTIAWCATRKPFSIEEELKKLAPSDRQALSDLLEGTGVTAAQLVPIRLGTVEHTPLHRHERAIAVEQDRVAGLRLVDVPLKRLDALSALSGLRALSLNGTQLTSLSAVRGLSALELLDVSHNQIRDLNPLTGLPALKILDISQNQITELYPLVALPRLKSLDISANPIVKLPTPLPDRWTMKQDAAQTAAQNKASHPANWVSELPPREGKMANVKMVSEDPSSSWNGTIAMLKGAAFIRPLVGSTTYAGDRTVELTVAKGRVRAYVQFYPNNDSFAKTPDGFVFAEAEPGKPGSVTGRLQDTSGSPPHSISDRPWEYQLLVESLDGEAQAISFRIKR